MDVRQGARWMIERARAARRRGARQPVRRRPPQRAGPLLPERPDAGTPARRVGRPAGGRAVPAAAVASGARRRADRHARVDRVRAVHHAVRVGRRARAVRRVRTDRRRIASRASKPASTSCAGCAPGKRSRPSIRTAIENARIAPVPPEPLTVWIGGSVPAAIDRAARLGDAFLVGPGGDTRRGAAAHRHVPRGVRPPRPDARRRSRSGATSTSAPTTPTRTGSRGPSWRAATGASTPRRPSRAGSTGRRRVRGPRRDGLHGRHRASPRRRPDRGAALLRTPRGRARAVATGKIGVWNPGGSLTRLRSTTSSRRSSEEPRFGLDTEFHGERSYWPRLALIQIAWSNGIALVDPLAVDAARLAPLLEGPRVLVAHAAEQDLAILTRLCGHGPAQLVRHAGRGRLRRARFAVPRRAGREDARRAPRQGRPAHRLDPSPADRGAEDLRRGRRRVPARAAGHARRTARGDRSPRVGARRVRGPTAARAHAPRTGARVVADQGRAPAAGPVARRRAGSRGVAGAHRGDTSTSRRATCCPSSRSPASCSGRHIPARSCRGSAASTRARPRTEPRTRSSRR